MSDKRPWHETGWAWELELMVLFLVALGFVLPMVVDLKQPVTDTKTLTFAEQAALENENALDELNEVNASMRALLIGLIVVGLYIGHLIIVSNSLTFISTPAMYLFSPLIFGGVTYYRLLHHTTLKGEAIPLVEGTLHEKIGYPVAILGISILIARIRMRRQLNRYKNIDWTYKTKAHYDKGMLSEFGLTILPFLYPPREFLICSQGILIKGALYLIPLPFTHIQSVVQSKRRTLAANNINLATSGHKPVRIQTTESRQPIMITPQHPDEFVFQCAEANPTASHLFSSSATSHG